MKKSLKRVLSSMLAATMLVGTVSYGSFDTTPILNIAPTVVNAATEIGITECQGWLESAWVEWMPASTDGVSYYTVSYSKDGSSFTRIDNELIRRYGDGHWRADIVGLAEGSYTIKVEAFDSSDASVSSETADVVVESHDRTGFTFSPSSKLSHSDDPLQSGAYNGDGTLKSNANVIYITKASDIDTVTYEGFTGLSTILQNRSKQSSAPLAVRIIGKIDYSGGELNGSGYIQVKPSKSYTDINTTIEGIGEDTAVNFGFLLRNAGNVELRNMAIHDFGDDGISLDTDNANIWIHNMEFFYGEQGSGDKAKGDGSSDVKNDSQYVTLSYNHYWDAGKCSLCGMKSESGDNFITYHHNWFDHSDSRHPRIRTMSVHVYNNYYDGNAKYGVGTSAASSALVEGNYFRNCKYPTLQGSVGCDDDGSGGSSTFDDSPAIGAVKFVNNTVVGANSKWTTGSDGEASSNADACLVTDRSQSINYTTAAGAKYNNFDTSGEQASYIQGLTIESAETAKANVEKYAGKTGGGDFKEATGFAFDNSVDDTDSEINTKLRTALTNYSNDNVSSTYTISSIGGSVDGSFVPEEPEDPTETTTSAGGEDPSTETTTTSEPVAPTGGKILNVTESGKTSDFFNVTADSVSTNKGTVNYNGLTLTDSIKMNSKATITFTNGATGSLVLVFNPDNAGNKIDFDGEVITVPSNGIVTISDIAAGPHTLTRNSGESALYYLAYSDNESGEEPSSETTTEATTVATTEATTEATTAATTEATTEKPSETTTEATDYLTIDSDMSLNNDNVTGNRYFNVTGNKTSGNNELQIGTSGKIEFTVADGANVSVTARHASSTDNTDRTLSMSNGTTVTYKAGESAKTNVLGTNLPAGTYTITVSNSINITSLDITFTSEPEPSVVKGDANDDGVVTSADVKEILNYVVGLIESVANPEAADVNNDSRVSSSDAYIIQKYIKTSVWQ